MKLRIISPTVHGLIDYSAAVALIASPFLLGLGSSTPVAFWLSIITGIAVILVSTNTQYAYSLFKNIPFDGHLAIDLAAATSFAIAPFLFGMTGLDLVYYVTNATVVFLVVALSHTPRSSATV